MSLLTLYGQKQSDIKSFFLGLRPLLYERNGSYFISGSSPAEFPNNDHKLELINSAKFKRFQTAEWIIKSESLEPSTTNNLFYASLAIPQIYRENEYFRKNEPRVQINAAGTKSINGYTLVVAREILGPQIPESSIQSYFNKNILPLIDNYYNKAVVGNNQIDIITKNIIKTWYESEKSNFYKNYKSIMKQLRDEEWDGNGNFEFLAVEGYLAASKIPFDSSFFSELLNPTLNLQQPAGYVLEHLGLNKYVLDNSDSSFWSRTEFAFAGGTIGNVESSRRSGSETFRTLLENALNLEEADDAEDILGLRQCALTTALLHDQFRFTNYWMDPGYNSPLYVSGATNSDHLSYRIYPVKKEGLSPASLINHSVINRNSISLLYSGNTTQPQAMIRGLFWVYEEKPKEIKLPNGETTKSPQKLREVELASSSRIYENKLKKISAGVSGQTLDLIQKEVSRNHKTKASYYYLENTKIQFEGTNPSTARNDVKVEMTWKLGSLEALDGTLAFLTSADGVDDNTRITVKDLITLPITKTPNSTDGAGQFLTNQYSPNYSRVRLKVAPFGDTDGIHRFDSMILDLAIIDHNISRQSDTGQTTLTINYRGYFESVLAQPFNDALASPEIIENRIERQEEGIDKLMEEGCKYETIAAALRLEQQNFSREGRLFKTSSLINRLLQNKSIHHYKLNARKMKVSTFGNRVDARQDLVESVFYSTEATILTDSGIELTDAIAQGENNEENIERINAFESFAGRFFFLGDLMHIMLDCLYKPATSQHWDHLKNLNLKFIVGTINVPNPKNPGGPPIVINPLSIPVDFRYFVQWMNSTIVKKGVISYPVGTFIRDLIERLVNGIIYDTCFSLLLPDERAPILRSQFFTSSEKQWFKKNQNGELDPFDPFQNGQTPDILFPKSVAIRDTANNSSVVIDDTNYCMIYQQVPSFKRQLMASQTKTLKEDEFTPSIFYGTKNLKNNYVSNVSFSKTDSPFLREARYFNSNYGGLSLLANVYDLSFDFKKRKANTLFYPGSIFNFVLLDWGASYTEDAPPWRSRSFGESDPHVNGTIANIMGMGGYFIVNRVEYNLGEIPTEFEIKITSKFLGTDADRPLNRVTTETKAIEDKQECKIAYNVIATRFNEIGGELRQQEGSSDKPITSLEIATIAQTSQPEGERNEEAAEPNE